MSSHKLFVLGYTNVKVGRISGPRKGMEFSIFVDRYNAVTLFGKKVQEGPPPLPPEPWQDRRPACCRDVNARRPTSWRVSSETMEIVVLTGFKSDRRVSPRPYLFTVCDDHVTEKNVHSTLQSRIRGGRITVYRGAASSSGPKWRSCGNIISPTVDTLKYVITPCGLQISNFLKRTRVISGRVKTSAFSGSGCWEI